MYLLLGAPDKLMLDYEWVDIKVHRDSVFEFNAKLTNMLRRLIHLAATEFADYSKNKHVSKYLKSWWSVQFQIPLATET